jgi:hypothetical protein
MIPYIHTRLPLVAIDFHNHCSWRINQQNLVFFHTWQHRHRDFHIVRLCICVVVTHFHKKIGAEREREIKHCQVTNMSPLWYVGILIVDRLKREIKLCIIRAMVDMTLPRNIKFLCINII